MPSRDDDYELLHPREFPDPDEQGPALLPCPHCLGVISELSERCPHCGNYLSEEDAPSRKPWWIIVGALVCLAITVFWLIAEWL